MYMPGWAYDWKIVPLATPTARGQNVALLAKVGLPSSGFTYRAKSWLSR
jgi:hypothetical protein